MADRPLDPLETVRSRLDPTTVPFTDRGSRILVFREPHRHRLYVRVCERWPKLEYAEGTYRVRPPLLKEVELLDGDGQPLAWDLAAYPHVLVFHTPAGRFELCFATPELLALRPPRGRWGIRFVVRADHFTPDRRGGRARGVRNVAYTTNARILRNQAVATEAGQWRVTVEVDDHPQPLFTLNITPRLGFDRRIQPLGLFEDAERRWRQWFDRVPPCPPNLRAAYLYAWYLMRAGLISSRFYVTREAMVPSKVHYVGLWQWDAFFHALAYRHVDAQLAHDQFRVLFDHQRPDGMVPDCVFDEGLVERMGYPVDASVTKPPVAGWCLWRVYEATGDTDFLDEMYEPLTRWQRWWLERCDRDGDGVCQYDHPFSSGLDDSPLWDRGMPVESPDLNSYLCLQAESLGQMAAALSLPEEAALWRAQADQLAASLLQHLYDPKARVFWAQRMTEQGHERVPVLAAVSLFPLLTGRMPEDVRASLVDRLEDPESFWTPYPVPTVARSDPTYDPDRMWRGPVWVNVNYLLIDALLRCGYPDRARELCDRTLDMVAAFPDIREYYHPETGQPGTKAAPAFGWSAALFIDLAVRRAQGEI
ncbi:MAG: trehalase family glycosidase [Armatimonadota bacterium]|nr:trehalase family glycosidase [Armatimonadota bacterium]MDR5676339.1 trehalase family glycosidase [Armatimonadota bacterium]MDR5689012.1 trehalase family glycosidase [Armatimonadota bacterium]MDR7389298.1 trehalase family glycosidase [Armatimonadota bacterium]MDR7392133.1 trehalase family glycosidase [Armatimonadota bacterium]